jgi:hypothetical protein
MSTGALILSFLGGSAVGSVATALYTTSQERAERFRERMLTTAEAFLKAIEVAETRVESFSQAERQHRTAKARLAAFYQAAPQWRHIDIDAEQDPLVRRVLQELFDLMNAVAELFDYPHAERTGIALQQRLVSAEQLAVALDKQTGVWELQQLTRLTIQDAATAYGVMTAEIGGFRALEELTSMLPRVQLVFTERIQDDPVTSAAFRTARALTAWMRSITEESEAQGVDLVTTAEDKAGTATADAESEPPERPAKTPAELRLDATTQTQTFASEVSTRIRKHWL